MANIHAEAMTAADVSEIARPILTREFKEFGFQDVTVKEEEDFDGAYIFRMTASAQSKVPAKILIDVLDEIHRALRGKGEERYVYLSTLRPESEDVEEDLE